MFGTCLKNILITNSHSVYLCQYVAKRWGDFKNIYIFRDVALIAGLGGAKNRGCSITTRCFHGGRKGQFSLPILVAYRLSTASLVPRPSSLVGKNKGEKTYHVTDVTDCGQFQERERTPTHSEHANTGLPKSVHLHYTQGGS